VLDELVIGSYKNVKAVQRIERKGKVGCYGPDIKQERERERESIFSFKNCSTII
jgi:hypothetical protein